MADPCPMVARGERTAASKPAARKAKKAGARAQQKKAQRTAKKQATRKAAHKTTRKAAHKTPHKIARKASKASAARDRRRDATPVSKPPKLDMNAEVMEFIAAIDAYRQEYHRPFPGWSEILFVLKNLGYTKVDD